MSTTIDSLREQVEQRRLQAEMADLERVLRAADLESRSLLEAEWGDIVDRKEYLYDTPGFGYGLRDGRISRPDDRANGSFKPFFENEMDLASIRGIGRFLGTAMDTGVGILENLTNYTIGSGFTYEVQAIDNAPEDLVATAQSCVDAFTDQLAERESFQRARGDGEWYAWVHEFGGEPIADIIEPEFVTEPRDTRAVEDYIGEYGLNWSYGIASVPNRPARVIGYFVSWYGSASDWDYVPAAEMLHNKVNSPTGVKRGLSDFYSVYLNLERAAKLLGNTLQGSAIQACIAYIRKHAAGTSNAAITAFANSKADYTFQTPKVGGGSKTVRQEKFYPGRVVDTNGTDYVAGPLGTSNAPVYVGVMQAAFRVAGARWAMPEYMISGDASNANYASTLVAGGPFDRATQARQDPQVRMFTKAHWMALDIRCKRGRFAKWGIWTLAQLQEVIRLNVTPPTVAVQDAKSAEDIRKLRKDAGILSARTWAAQVDLDYDAEVANGAKALEPMSFGLGATPAPDSADPTQSAEPTANPVANAETSLNGAQITAAIQVLSDLSAGRSTPEIAMGLLLAVGIDEPMARRMVKSASTLTPASQPTPKQAAVTAALESVRTTEEAKAILSESYP